MKALFSFSYFFFIFFYILFLNKPSALMSGWIPSNLQSLQRITDYAVTEYICSAGIGN